MRVARGVGREERGWVGLGGDGDEGFQGVWVYDSVYGVRSVLGWAGGLADV